MTNQPFRQAIPDPAAVRAAIRITDRAGRQAAMNALQRPAGLRPMSDPQVGVQGFNSVVHDILPLAPADDSVQTAAELAELGLMVLLQDVPLAELNTHPDAIRGAQTLAAFGVPDLLRAPGPEGLFRLGTHRLGDRIGRLVTQPIPLGWNETSFNARRRLGNYITTQAQWEALQAGRAPGHPDLPRQILGDVVPMSTGRDVASLAHQDWPINIPELVAFQLLAARAPLSSRFPARPHEVGFIDYGGNFDTPCAVTSCRQWAKMAWFAKWYEGRQRPHEMWVRAVRGELHPSFLQHAKWIVDRVGEYLPMVYAEGPPIHSDNPSGHAFFSGFGFTILKAYFADGPVPALGITGSLHAELDLMAWHMSIGRCWARIHSSFSIRTGLRFGEQSAFEHLYDLGVESPQKFGNTKIVGFDGQVVNLLGN
jgi:hypothetical protein